MFCRVPYVSLDGNRHRPLLTILFTNGNNMSSNVFGLVDSGADHTLIPYSLGKTIGLPEPSETEVLSTVNGVGGSVSFIERKCEILLPNHDTRKLYTFNETVWWTYPDAETATKLAELEARYREMEELEGQAVAGTKLAQHLQQGRAAVEQEFITVNSQLEGDVLLGRPFFNNFEFIQFFHKDRDDGSQCHFNYKVAAKKPAAVMTFEEVLQALQAAEPTPA